MEDETQKKLAEKVLADVFRQVRSMPHEVKDIRLHFGRNPQNGMTCNAVATMQLKVYSHTMEHSDPREKPVDTRYQ